MSVGYAISAILKYTALYCSIKSSNCKERLFKHKVCVVMQMLITKAGTRVGIELITQNLVVYSRCLRVMAVKKQLLIIQKR